MGISSLKGSEEINKICTLSRVLEVGDSALTLSSDKEDLVLIVEVNERNTTVVIKTSLDEWLLMVSDIPYCILAFCES